VAWRIHDSAQRGEIDNRERGRVQGRLWLHGRTEPVVLELSGNACPDLAGCLLTFENPAETIPLRTNAAFAAGQRGTIGDLTASRKVRVPDVPLEEFIALRKAGKPAPEHTANSLFLEWFSEANGRVVIESTEYRLTISPPAWTLLPEEERQRQEEAREGFTGFLGKLNAALAAARHEPAEDKEWDEFDYEHLMRESDARTDKYLELLDKYRDHPDRERIVAQEMGWTRLDKALEEDGRSLQQEASLGDSDTEGSGAPADGAASNEDDWLDVDEINDICAEAAEHPPQPDPATEGRDWIRTEDGEVTHPLSLRAFNGSMELWHKCKELTLRKGDDPDLTTLLNEYQIAGAKLAGALDSLAYGRESREGAFIVAYLKRALAHLHAAQSALERVAPKQLLPANTLASTRAELFSVREEILRLMREFRGQI
jgi:hypothetical protein